MGCQVSTDGSHFEKSEFDNLWKRMNSNDKINNNHNKSWKKSSEWKILRIILVSTYKDFKNERSAMLDLIQNKLQPYASEKNVYLQLEDFAFGSQASYFEDGSTIYLIERCAKLASKDGKYFYIHFLGECSGYIIDSSFGDSQFLFENQISYGQSLTEVFLQLSGLHHTQSLYLRRNSSFLRELPFNVSNFIDQPKNRERANYLAEMIRNNVPTSKFIEYSVKTSGINNTHFKQILFDDLSSAISPIETLIYDYIDNLQYPDDKWKAIDKRIVEYYTENGKIQKLQNVVKKVQINIQKKRSCIVFGDYCSGKTTVLNLLRSENGIIHVQEGFNTVDFRREIDAKLKVKLQDVNEKFENLLLIDDFHLLSKEACEILINYPDLTIIATSRKKKLAFNGLKEVIQIESLSSENVSVLLTYWINGEENKNGISSVKASNILKISQQKRRKSIGNIEDGQSRKIDENEGWNVLKCQVIGSLARLGNSEEKCAQLAQLSTSSVVEADIRLIEASPNGHILIATLCFLTIIENGLNEIELRSLLASEYTLLPISITRNYRNLPFEYCSDDFGKYPIQIPPLRWYIVINRIRHLLFSIHNRSNHFILPSVCRKVVRKKFLKNPANTEHFQKRLRSFLNKNSRFEWMKNRVSEIERFLK